MEERIFFVALYAGDTRPLAITGGLRPRRKAAGVVRGEVEFPEDLLCVAYGRTWKETFTQLGNGCCQAGLKAYRAW